MTTEIVQRTPQQMLVATLRGDTFKEQLAAALPASVTPDHFVRIASTAVMNNADIADLERTSVLRSFMQCAADGLMPDGKEAAITPRRNRQAGTVEAVYVPMIGGYRKKAAEHGWTLRTAVVYENDTFEHKVVDGDESILHIPVRPGTPRGELIASYAIAKHRDGRKIMTVLHPEDIAKRRESAGTDKVWKAHPAAMWEKSAGRDLFGQLGLAEGDAAVQRMLNADEFTHGEAAATLYGPQDPPVKALAPAADAAPTSSASNQQADGAAQETSSGAASSVPGDDFADEPRDDDAPVATPDDALTDEVVEAGRQAALFTMPNGKHKDRALGEIFNDGDTGIGYLKWALAQSWEDRPELRAALWSFARVYLRDEYQEALAREEASHA